MVDQSHIMEREDGVLDSIAVFLFMKNETAMLSRTVQFSAGIFNHIYMVFIIVLFLIAVLVVNNDSMQA